MKIEHIAVYTKQLEELKEFYTYYFHGTASDKYINSTKGFESYFITFESGARLELMRQRDVTERKGAVSTGFNHLAFSVGSKEKVDEMTKQLEQAGLKRISGPRLTGDGYYESCILDPDGNIVEITI
jgi:lactoylglutathione lyase